MSDSFEPGTAQSTLLLLAPDANIANSVRRKRTWFEREGRCEEMALKFRGGLPTKENMKLAFFACAIALAFTATAGGSPSKPPAAPVGLHAFELKPDERVKHTYALMPAFSWNAVRDASTYELQLATSRAFSDATVLYEKSYDAPVASIQLQVPWMTGRPYALWVRVRAVTDAGTSRWGSPFGFNTEWQDVPNKIDKQTPNGLIRWSPVDGATGYQVWFMNAPRGLQTHFTTLTNVADEREYWTFHSAAPRTILWRVRAIRLVSSSSSLPNGIQVVRYGRYSDIFTTTTSAMSAGKIHAVAAVSDAESTASTARPHQLTPGLDWTGSKDFAGNGASSELWRAYVFSDKQCVNPVMTSSLIGGPAWAPREGDPLNMPQTLAELEKARLGLFPLPEVFAKQNNVFTADGDTPSASESAAQATASGGGTTPPASGGAATSQTGASATTTAAGALSLPDNGWPEGRYWWTVVPVAIVPVVTDPEADPSTAKLEYHDLTLPQDACAAGQVWQFGMQSLPVTTTDSQTPYASGVGNGTRVVAAATKRPAFRELPLVTWKSARAADTYEIELSRQIYPWKAVKKTTSVVTSVVLPLAQSDKGVWYYRVRGVNPNLTGPAQKLAWSKPVAIRITGDVFVVVR